MKQHFTYGIHTEQVSENTATPEAKDHPRLFSYLYMMEIFIIICGTKRILFFVPTQTNFLIYRVVILFTRFRARVVAKAI
mgnify:CR=1 FL=1